MRMTNKIMQNNSLYNINQNKLLQDKLSTQMSTQKKLTRPSDDPVVAIRALRLRSSVSELTQFYEKNAPDADSWLKVTSDGLGTVTSILTDLSKNATKGANKDLTADDLDIIVTQMKSLSEEFYATGNLDYAGRYVFTGYRTNTPMTFTASDVANTKTPIPEYEITEQLTLDSFDTVSNTTLGGLNGLTSASVNTHREEETNIRNEEFFRLRLAYDKIKEDGNLKLTCYDASASPATETDIVTIEHKSKAEAYEAISAANAANESKAYIIKETGEILFSNEAYKTLQANDDPANKEFRITYKKNEWSNADLRPEHYFKCSSTSKDTPPVVTPFNSEYTDQLYLQKKKQVIAYDVGYNQTIEINTTADEVFTHSLARDVDDLSIALKDLKNIDEIRRVLKQAVTEAEENNSPDLEDIRKQYDAADKAYTYIRENLHDLMQKSISKMQAYLDESNVAITDNGTRASRLALINNRLMEQKTTFRTLQSENEDVDIAEVAVSLTSAELTYNSSLMATGKIMQTSLMNYI